MVGERGQRPVEASGRDLPILLCEDAVQRQGSDGGHARILQDGVERARSKLEYTSLAAAFCQDEFTVGELRRVYEIVWGTELDPRNFHRKVTGARDFLVQTGTMTTSGGRPAQLYRRGSAVLLYPPMLRSRDHGISRRRPDSIEFPGASS